MCRRRSKEEGKEGVGGEEGAEEVDSPNVPPKSISIESCFILESEDQGALTSMPVIRNKAMEADGWK